MLTIMMFKLGSSWPFYFRCTQCGTFIAIFIFQYALIHQSEARTTSMPCSISWERGWSWLDSNPRQQSKLTEYVVLCRIVHEVTLKRVENHAFCPYTTPAKSHDGGQLDLFKVKDGYFQHDWEWSSCVPISPKNTDTEWFSLSKEQKITPLGQGITFFNLLIKREWIMTFQWETLGR